MIDFNIKLSAYLDGELDPKTAMEVESRLATDASAQRELDSLLEADAKAKEQFDEQLTVPLSLGLARIIRDAPFGEPKRISRMLAASVILLVLGGIGGYVANETLEKPSVSMARSPDWLNEIAGYHTVYSNQKRHLVEVDSTETEHLVEWLGTSVGTSFSIPNLTRFGLQFEGGRLLVANSIPVAQLMYTTSDGDVIALCLQKNQHTKMDDETVFTKQTINGFDLVSWSQLGISYVVIGSTQTSNLAEIAQQAALDV